MADREIKVVVETRSSGGGGTRQTVEDLEQQLRTTNNIYEKQKLLRNLYKRTATDTGELTGKAAKYKTQLEEVNKKVRDFNRIGKEGHNTWGKALDSYQFKFNALGNIISNVTSFALRSFTQGIKSVVNISKDFEKQMSAVRAISGATREEFDKLRASAVRLGGSTIFTAKQVAELQTAYSKLGFTTSEILNATEATLDLAAATDEDLGSAAAIAGSTLRAFQLDASETQRVVDTMAKSFTSSALDMEKFRESMKFVAPVARQAGFSIEETTAVLAKLADTGLYGSLAGTSMRNIMLRMVDSSSKLAKEAGGAQRGLQGLSNIFEALNERGLDLSKSLELTDRRAVTAFATLSNAIPGVRELADELYRATGASQEMADIRIDNFAGSVTLLKSAWEGLVVQINEGNGALKWFVDRMTEFINGVKFLSDKKGFFADLGIDRANEDLKVFNEQIKDNGKDRLEALNEELVTARYWAKENVKIHDEAEKALLRAQQTATINRRKVIKERTEAERDAFISMSASEEYLKIIENQIRAEEDRRKKAAIDEENRRKAEEQRKIDADKEAYEKRLEEEAKFAKNRQKALDVAEKIRIESIKDSYLREIEEERFALGVRMRTLTNYFDNGLLSYEEYYKAVEYAREAHNQKMIAIATADIKKQAEAISSELENGKKLAESTLEIIGAEGDSAPSIWERTLGKFEFTNEMRSQLKRGISEVVGMFSTLADQEKEWADLAVENSERKVDQLQRDLEREIALAEKGYANNKTLLEKELADAKRAQDRAIAIQEEALRKQQTLESIAQTISMGTAIAEIIKNAAKTYVEPITASIIGLSVAGGLIAAFGGLKKEAQAAAKYGEGGEVGGRKHSQGGTMIEAEKGEYVIRASQYAKYPELVEAINYDTVSSTWRDINRDLSVSLDDSKTASMLGRMYGSRVVEIPGGRIEYYGNKTRRIRYATRL